MGTSLGSSSCFLLWVAESEMIAATVVSLPVPAVVGTAIRGRGRRRTFSIPARASALVWLATAAATALAVSITDPPPTATTASQPEQAFLASATMAKVGSGCTPSNTAYSTPALRMLSSTPSSRPDWCRKASVITRAFLAPSICSRRPVSLARPGPM